MRDLQKTLKKTYDNISYLYDRKFSGAEDIPYVLPVFLHSLPKGGKILDVGCGPGLEANYMHEQGFEVVGVDISEKMLALARKRNPAIEFLQSDLIDVEFREKIFYGIAALSSLIHIRKKDVPAVLKKFNSYLKKGGLLYLELQEGKSKEGTFSTPVKSKEKIFINVFSFGEIRQLLKKAGFLLEYVQMTSPHQKWELPFNKLSIIVRKS